MNQPKKRAQFSKDILYIRNKIKSISAFLAADSDVSVLEIRRTGEENFKRVKAHDLLDRLLQLVPSYVDAIRPKRHRGEWMMPHLIQ